MGLSSPIRWFQQHRRHILWYLSLGLVANKLVWYPAKSKSCKTGESALIKKIRHTIFYWEKKHWHSPHPTLPLKALGEAASISKAVSRILIKGSFYSKTPNWFWWASWLRQSKSCMNPKVIVFGSPSILFFARPPIFQIVFCERGNPFP